MTAERAGLAERVAALRRVLAGERDGVLATLSARHPGWPFASLAPYALDARGEPILLLSDLAEHTRNLRADARASLFVQDRAQPDPAPDPGQAQAGARLTLLGRVEPVAADALAAARDAYLARHPQAAAYLALADFHLYRLRVHAARFIAGFGDMGWIEGDALRTPGER
jgi:heme iron utilization protein